MSLIKKKAKQIWAFISRARNIEKQENRVQVVQPITTIENCDSDDKENIEAESLSTYRTIWHLINVLANVVGVSTFEALGWSPKVAFATVMVCCGYYLLFYTMAAVWGDASALLEVTCMFGVLLPASLKYRLVLKEGKNIPSFHIFFEKILINNPKGKRAEHLGKEMKDAYKIVKIFIVITLLCFAVFALYPIYAYVTENRLVQVMRIEIPFLDQTKIKDYLIALVIMLVLAVLAVIGSVAFDLLTLMLLMEYGSLVTQFVLDLEEYHEIWTEKESFSQQYRDVFLHNMCLKYQDLDNYLRYFNELFSTNTCHSICVLYGSLIFAFYAVFKNGWISGYGFCIFCFVQLWIQCILGTSVSSQNDRLSRAIYFTPWYEYPVKEQKTILMLLHASSFNATVLWIGPFAPLNVATGMQITKNIYTYYTATSNLS